MKTFVDKQMFIYLCIVKIFSLDFKYKIYGK